MLHKSEEVVLFCFWLPFLLSSLFCTSPWPKSYVCCFSLPSALWLVRLVRKPTAHYLVSAQVLLHRVHVVQSFSLSYYPATLWTLWRGTNALQQRTLVCKGSSYSSSFLFILIDCLVPWKTTPLVVTNAFQTTWGRYTVTKPVFVLWHVQIADKISSLDILANKQNNHKNTWHKCQWDNYKSHKHVWIKIRSY